LRIGIPRETKVGEYRVALTPAGVAALVSAGHEVFVESLAGQGSRLDDDRYKAAGAGIASASEVWANSDLVLKVGEPIEREYRFFRDGLVLFAFLHLATNVALTRALVESRVTAVAYETVEQCDGTLPLLVPMSEIAGRIAVQTGAALLEKAQGGRGMLLGGVPGVAPSKVVILGGGVVGYNAARVARRLGASVTILERSDSRLRHLSSVIGGNLTILQSSQLEVDEAIVSADLVVGAVLVPGARTATIVQRGTVGEIKPRSVIVDVAIDQGGCVETSIATTHAVPTYIAEGVVHYCVTNMPSAVPITSTVALSNVSLPYFMKVAQYGIEGAISRDPALARGVNVSRGRLLHEAVAAAHRLQS